MSHNGVNPSLTTILTKHQSALLSDWVREQAAVRGRRGAAISESELRQECSDFLGRLRATLERGQDADINSQDWGEVREMLEHLSRSRLALGFSPSETVSFVFSLKKPLFRSLRQELAGDAQSLGEATWATTELIDQLGLYTTEVYLKGREELITRQQQELLELSTPVVKLWEGIVALPMIGTLDSVRTQMVMENLLQKILETGSAIAILDITGVPTVDTLTAQHLLKTVAAARLMGAECIISGIRPPIAQTIVHLGVDLGTVTTKATLADALALALERTGRVVTRVKAGRDGPEHPAWS
ncbi:MAG TPA: STAS domain-containing protein [Isosphaeraceae bacterium]|nr:STAS domain-containing protein [Isosphaeraceae bacterium]